MRATIVAMMLIAAVMYWREGFYTGSLLQQWILIGIALMGRGWFWLCRRRPLVAWFVLGFLRGLLGRR